MKLNDYRLQPYTRRCDLILNDEDDGSTYWVAWIEELNGCEAYGDTLADAMLNLQGTFDCYIKAMLKWKKSIPVPGDEANYARSKSVVEPPETLENSKISVVTGESPEQELVVSGREPYKIERPLLQEA